MSKTTPSTCCLTCAREWCRDAYIRTYGDQTDIEACALCSGCLDWTSTSEEKKVMRKFRETKSCPKCGRERFHGDLDLFRPHFVPEGPGKWPRAPTHLPAHLDIECYQTGNIGCGYVFKEQCADAGKPVLPLLEHLMKEGEYPLRVRLVNDIPDTSSNIYKVMIVDWVHRRVTVVGVDGIKRSISFKDVCFLDSDGLGTKRPSLPREAEAAEAEAEAAEAYTVWAAAWAARDCYP